MVDDEIEADIFLGIAQLSGKALQRAVFAGQKRAEIENGDFFVRQFVGQDDFGCGHGLARSQAVKLSDRNPDSVWGKSILFRRSYVDHA